MGAPVIDLLDPEWYGEAARRDYAWMRANAPVYYDERNQLWGVSTYQGVRAAEGNAAVFSNAQGSRAETGALPWMMDMDAPDHTKRRKLVNRAFTPNRVRAMEPHIREICDDIIDTVCERGACDFKADIAAPLPLIVICDMIGIPAADRYTVLAWSDDMLGSLNGGDDAMQAAADAFGAYLDYANTLIAQRRSEPVDDLISILVHADRDGDILEDHELAFEILLLLLGGDETTRNVTCGGMEQLLLHPDQMRALIAAPAGIPVAVEEMLRWVSPIKNMSRTLTRDIEFGGQQLRAGDKALMLYEAANLDEAQFDGPEHFDATRTPNDHIAFGFGAHFCLGASLARIELHAIFERLLARLPDLRLASDGPPPRALTGIIEMPVTFTPHEPA